MSGLDIIPGEPDPTEVAKIKAASGEDRPGRVIQAAAAAEGEAGVGVDAVVAAAAPGTAAGGVIGSVVGKTVTAAGVSPAEAVTASVLSAGTTGAIISDQDGGDRTSNFNELSDSELDLKKKRLEIRQLERSLSARYGLLEWLKAIGTSTAILVFLWTAYSGLTQFRHSEELEVDSRLERLAEHLNSTAIGQRYVGVAEAQAFLSDAYSPKHQLAALRFLSDAVAIESDSSLRISILRALAHLDSKVIDVEILNSTLQSVIERNRQMRTECETQIAGFPSVIFADTIGHRSWAQLDPQGDPEKVDTKSEDMLSRLDATATEIVTLVEKGATTRDFSDIYCDGCDFARTKATLARSDFRRAYLHNANLSGIILSGSTFDDAVLIGARFDRAKLKDVALSISADDLSEQFSDTRGADLAPPTFDGADLTGARLDGRTVVLVKLQFTPDGAFQLLPPAQPVRHEFTSTTILPPDALSHTRWFYIVSQPGTIDVQQLSTLKGPHFIGTKHASVVNQRITYYWADPASKIPKVIREQLAGNGLPQAIIDWMNHFAATCDTSGGCPHN